MGGVVIKHGRVCDQKCCGTNPMGGVVTLGPRSEQMCTGGMPPPRTRDKF